MTLGAFCDETTAPASTPHSYTPDGYVFKPASVGSQKTVATQWMKLGADLLPFADAASAELPLAKLLRLSLFQVTVGMAVVLLIGTLNRVMIVELGVPV